MTRAARPRRSTHRERRASHGRPGADDSEVMVTEDGEVLLRGRTSSPATTVTRGHGRDLPRRVALHRRYRLALSRWLSDIEGRKKDLIITRAQEHHAGEHRERAA